ncbi:MAG: mechanosensitive ion channel domain-containing protein [Chloroflexota bacterium]
MITSLTDGLTDLFSQTVLLQIAAGLGLLLVAWLVKRLLAPQLARLQTAAARLPVLSTWPRLLDLFPILQSSLWPLVAWLLGQAAVTVAQQEGWPHDLLQWFVPFLLLWLVYQIFASTVSLRLAAEQATWWSHRVLRPLFLAVALLQGVGLLDDLLGSGIQFQDSRITIGTILAGLLVFAFFLLLSRTSRRFVGETVLPRAGLDRSLTHVLATFLAYTIVVVGVVSALNVVGIPLTSLTVIAGGLSVGLGFGLQSVVSNFVSGIILLFERSIVPGDVVQVGDEVGVVETIGIRSMRVKNNDNVELIVPNSQFLTETVINFTRSDPKVRVAVAVGVGYDSDPRLVEQALLEAADHPAVLADPSPSVQFTDFGDSALNFRLLVWTTEAHRIPTLTSDLRYQVWDSLKAHQIEIPFPQRDIHIRSIQ